MHLMFLDLGLEVVAGINPLALGKIITSLPHKLVEMLQICVLVLFLFCF